MKTKDVQSMLGDELGKHLSFRKGVFTVKKSYYWGLTNSGEWLWNRVKEKISSAQLVKYGNHFHSFVGGAKTGSAQDSYFWVKFTIPELKDNETTSNEAMLPVGCLTNDGKLVVRRA